MTSGGEVHMMARGWRGDSLGGVWRQAVWGLVMGLSVGVVAGAPAAMQPSSSSSRENGAGGEVGCERPITDVVWGFGLTLLANFVAVWNVLQHTEKRKLPKLVGTLGFTFIGPIWILMISFGNTFQYVPMVCHLHKMKNEEMTIARIWAMLNPWSKSPTRLLADCNIIMYVRKGEESELLRQSMIWSEEIHVKDETEAMVVGEEPDEETKKNEYEEKQLSDYGKVGLLWGEYFSSGEKFKILPKYGQLKFLRANSGFAVIAIGIQAIGYIYAVIFRSVKDLRLAPVEVIGLVINIILLIGVILYGTSNPCARVLVIYMNNEQEEKFVKALQSKQKEDFKVNLGFSSRFFFLGMITVVLLLCNSILIYFIVRLRRATNMMIVLPLIIFVASLLLSQVFLFLAIIAKKGQFVVLHYIIIGISVLSSIVAYVWALIVTFYYWKSQLFNTRLELIDLSQLIPFIG